MINSLYKIHVKGLYKLIYLYILFPLLSACTSSLTLKNGYYYNGLFKCNGTHQQQGTNMSYTFYQGIPTDEWKEYGYQGEVLFFGSYKLIDHAKDSNIRRINSYSYFEANVFEGNIYDVILFKSSISNEEKVRLIQRVTELEVIKHDSSKLNIQFKMGELEPSLFDSNFIK